jgi:hypothetical protein
MFFFLLLLYCWLFSYCNASQQEQPEKLENDNRRTQIINKVGSVGRVMRMFQTLRKEREAIVQLKGFGNGVIRQGLLLEGPEAIKSALSEFQKNMELDKPNLRRFRFFFFTFFFFFFFKYILFDIKTWNFKE